MKRALVVGTLLGLAAAPVTAADVKIYGQAHLALSYLDNGYDYSATNLSSNASRLGFRANHQIMPNLYAMAQIEGQVDFNSSESHSLSSRNTFLGLGGNWGELKIGYHDSPMKTQRIRVDLFGNQLGDARNAILEGFDNYFKNSILYTTPSYAGVTADLHYSVETVSNGRSADNNKNDAWGIGLTYKEGPLYASIAHERWNNAFYRNDDSTSPATPIHADRHATRLAAYYDIANVRITGLIHVAKDDDRGDNKAYGLGVRYGLAPQIALKLQYYRLDHDDNDRDADLVAVGADYKPIKNMTLYLNYSQVANKSDQDRKPWGKATTANPDGAIDHTARGVALGVIYNF